VRNTRTNTLRTTGEDGIALDKAAMSKHFWQSTLAKLKLNSRWGNWAQNQNRTQIKNVKTKKEYYKLLTSAGTEVTNLIFSKDDAEIGVPEVFQDQCCRRKKC
jgi:hypothetical protein